MWLRAMEYALQSLPPSPKGHHWNIGYAAMLLVPGHIFWAPWEELGLVPEGEQLGHGVSLFRSGLADLELYLYIPD